MPLLFADFSASTKDAYWCFAASNVQYAFFVSHLPPLFSIFIPGLYDAPICSLYLLLLKNKNKVFSSLKILVLCSKQLKPIAFGKSSEPIIRDIIKFRRHHFLFPILIAFIYLFIFQHWQLQIQHDISLFKDTHYVHRYCWTLVSEAAK